MNKINNFKHTWIAIKILFPNLQTILYYTYNCPKYKGLSEIFNLFLIFFKEFYGILC